MTDQHNGQVATEDRERERELGVVAAAHAALDPERRAHRANILVESVLQVMRHGPLPEERVVQEVQRLWNAPSITAPLVRSALKDAQAANLAVPQTTMLSTTDWTLTDEGRRDAQEDVLWGQQVFENFEAEVRIRLEDDANRPLITDDQVIRIASKLREAIAMAAEGLYNLNIAASPGALRPGRFNERAALDHLRTLQPKAPRQAALRLLVAAINPTDSFADELVHLYVTANVLHGMVTRRDLATKPNLDGVRIAIDTSVLVDLPAGTTPAAQAVKEAFRLSQALGAQVIVADHTIREWSRLFDAANEEMKHVKDTVDVGPFAILIDNPFIRAFSAARADTPFLPWSRFRDTWRDPTRQLQLLGVNVRPNGNSTKLDKQNVTKMNKALVACNDKQPKRDPYVRRRRRNPSALTADAESAAMVARWREKLGRQSAYLVAQDRMIGRAYLDAFPKDRVPLAISLTAWVILAAALTTDDPEKHASCAAIVRNVALGESFVAIAAGYTYGDVVELATILASDPDAASPSDVSEFVQQVFDDLEEESSEGDRLTAVSVRAQRLLASRSARRNQRARRAAQMTKAQIERVRDEVREQADASIHAVVSAAADEREALKGQLAEKDAELAQERARAEEQGRRRRRFAFAASVAVVAMAAAVVTGVAGHLTTRARWIALGCSLALVGIFCVAYVTSRTLKWWWIAGGGVAAIAINVLTNVLSQLG